MALRSVSGLAFQARSKAKTGWDGPGQGTVAVQLPDQNTIVFEESGRWQPFGAASLAFSNTFRWTRKSDHIALEHLRFGIENPVFLFGLAPVSDGLWAHNSLHQCGQDQYTAELLIQPPGFKLTWHVHGPFKDEEIAYTYR